MNGVPPCYNPAHHHKSPGDSVEALPDFFREIYETARSVKPDALVEFCPCGTAYSFFTMPHFNMSVASDPESSFQIRSKGKTLKALMGDNVPYFGDHVELSDGANDFASTVGVGGVVGTQFVLPELVKKHSTSDLTPERQEIFEKWLRIYKEKMLSRGEYLGDLYDIGFDVPETHVIRKGGEMYYAFFVRHWSGPVELRGLQDRSYHIVDYVDNKDFRKRSRPESDDFRGLRQASAHRGPARVASRTVDAQPKSATERLQEIIRRNRNGEKVGVYAVCSAHPSVIAAAVQQAVEDESVLHVESTSSQVNQSGGYTGQTPSQFAEFIQSAAQQSWTSQASSTVGRRSFGSVSVAGTAVGSSDEQRL